MKASRTRVRTLAGSLIAMLCLSTLFLVPWRQREAQALGNSGMTEVWVVDQSDTRPDGGGTLYIYPTEALAGPNATIAMPEVIDLGGAARDFALNQTGTAFRRPHMLMFNGMHTHAILACVATGHVLFIDADSRETVGVVDAGVQAHAAIPAPDDSFVIVANQNGKLLQRIRTDYENNSFTLEDDATLNLAAGNTPSGALREDPNLRPDNAPICPIIDESGQFVFVTLRGGGMFVIDATTTPMQIVAEYDKNTVHPNGCGGVEINGKMYINAGGGTPANPLESDLYAFPMSGFSSNPSAPNTPTPKVIFSQDDRGFVDSHGAALSKRGGYLWLADRAANKIVVVDTRTDRVINEFSLVGAVSSDPAPDLMEFSPSGNRVFVALRGPNPLTANVAGVNNAMGSTPGVGVIRVLQGGRSGVLEAVAPISHIVDGVERADPHGLMVRHAMAKPRRQPRRP
jgi:DNA-binding beta-propeller fold protein YncE